ncbi:MAG: VOC family protein [Actinobacteria bacterium]|nr:VOC family protein [Actinomycetota bacterium]
MTVLTPYLNFPGTTEEAFEFYAAALGGQITGIARFSEFSEGMPPLSDEDANKVANMGLRLPNGAEMMGTDVLPALGQEFRAGNNFALHLEADSLDEAERIFAALAEGGNRSMEPAATEWAEWFAGCTDRYGVEWMVSYTGSVVFGG